LDSFWIDFGMACNFAVSRGDGQGTPHVPKLLGELPCAIGIAIVALVVIVGSLSIGGSTASIANQLSIPQATHGTTILPHPTVGIVGRREVPSAKAGSQELGTHHREAHKMEQATFRAAHGHSGWALSMKIVVHSATFVALAAVTLAVRRFSQERRATEVPVPLTMHLLATEGETTASQSSEGEVESIQKALRDARQNLSDGKSPGAGLESIEDQAAAAYADLINTSMGFDGDLSEEDAEGFAQGGMMDEGSKSKRGKGLFGDAMDIFGALGKGAHIVKQKDGRV